MTDAARQEQSAAEDQTFSADDFARMKSRAEAAEIREREVAQRLNEAAEQINAASEEVAKAHERISTEISRRVAADEAAIAQAIAAAQSDGDSAEKELADAIAANDASLIAKAQRRMGRADLALNEAETKNRSLQSWKQNQIARMQQEEATRQEQERQARERPQPQRQQPQPQTGATIDISGFPPGHQEWFRKHPEVIANTPDGEKERRWVIADHHQAVARGLVEGTPSYYEFVEGALQARRSDNGHQDQDRGQDRGQDNVLQDGTMEISLDQDSSSRDNGARVTRPEGMPRAQGARDHEVQTPQRPNSSSALPPSRSQTPANGNRSNGRITLSSGEQEAARISFPHLPLAEAYKEYAVNKQALISEGRL
jgi:hypothetical protein